MKIIPINEAEAVIDPLWDPALSELKQWIVEPGVSHGLSVRQNWCWSEFEWARRPIKGPALRMSRECGIDCSNYDRLVLSVMIPEAAVVRILAITDDGIRQMTAQPESITKSELILDLTGATRLDTVTIEIDASTDGISKGWFNWLGLQHSERLTNKLNIQSTWGEKWEKHLKDDTFEPQFKPDYGLVLNAEELSILIQKHETLTANGKTSPFVKAAFAAQVIPPETMIHDYVNFWGDSRYNRERDHGKFILNHGLNAAIAGHLLQDKVLLRLAARYALSIGMCKNWDDGFICRFPGGTFDHRCFVQSLCAYEVAGILDLAGEFFTDIGRDFLLRRLSEEAIGAINYNTWKHEYIFRCNQLAWFTPGRMLALGILQQHSMRVQPYIDIAYRELCESLEYTILPDGGYVEGPTYFRCVGRDAGLGVYYYSRIMGKSIEECIPASMKRCNNFADVVISTDSTQDVIAFCDARPLHDIISQAIMSGLLPGSSWARMLHNTINRNDGWPINEVYGPEHYPTMMADSAITWGLSERLKSTPIEMKKIVSLPDMGPIASHRYIGDQVVKLFIQGNQAGAGHTHEDKGSFVLEFGGETFAMDPGTCDYSHPLAGILHNCERHNMLVPYGVAERPAPQCPLEYDVKPSGNGDETAFHAEIDATLGWDNYYRHWHRKWDSLSPYLLTITDDYELIVGDGVEFYWQTRLPVAIDGSTAVITGQNSRIEVKAPAGCIWRVDELPLLDAIQHRLAFKREGKSGSIVVHAQIFS
ncbi:MAG: hypothetical protein WCO98_02655 [bacterium]